MKFDLMDAGSDERLAGRIVQRDSAALEYAYSRYAPLLRSAARRIVGDSADADEVLQDTFFQLWQSAALFDSARGSLIGWLLTMTRNKALSRRRQKLDHAPLDTVEAYSAGASTLEREIARQLINSALDGLPYDQCQAITLAYFEGLTCTEIATRTKSAEGTVKSRMKSALKRMKHDLSKKKAAKTVKTPAGGVKLQDILITNQLLTRTCRGRSSGVEKRCLRTLSEAAKNGPRELIECFLRMGMELCRAGSAGLSFLEDAADGNQVFRWTHLAGRLEEYAGGSTPRNFSPCGVTLDRDSPQLFLYPARYFQYFREVNVPIVEGLVIPFGGTPGISGTVWIASHSEKGMFDSEDARIMVTLTRFIQFSLPSDKTLRSSQTPFAALQRCQSPQRDTPTFADESSQNPR